MEIRQITDKKYFKARGTHIFWLRRSPLPRHTEQRHAAFPLPLQYSGFRFPLAAQNKLNRSTTHPHRARSIRVSVFLSCLRFLFALLYSASPLHTTALRTADPDTALPRFAIHRCQIAAIVPDLGDRVRWLAASIANFIEHDDPRSAYRARSRSFTRRSRRNASIFYHSGLRSIF